MGRVLSLRRATAADAPEMTRIARAAYTPYVDRMGGQHPAPLDADYDAVVADAEAWVAETDGALVGFLVLIGEGDHMLLDNVAVRPSHRGQGAGRALLTWAEERARAAGYDRIALYTHQTMVENQALYERIGYVETRRADEDGFARVFYEKSLSG
jgi:ribosomal protein S18 acetylase RimI-like enzyme